MPIYGGGTSRAAFRPVNANRLSVNLSHPLANGLVALFDIQHGAVRNLLRQSSGNHEAPLSGGTYDLRSNATVGQVASNWGFTGAETTALNFSGSFTVACWVKVESLASATSFNTVFSKSTFVNATNNSGWALQVRPNNAWNFCIFNNNGSYVWTAAQVTVGEHLIVGTLNPGVAKSFYIDGRKVNTSAAANTTMATTAGLTYSEPAVNVSPATDIHVRFCAGWSRILTDAEIWSLYDSRTRWDLYMRPPSDAMFPLPRRHWLDNEQVIGGPM